MTIGVGHHAAAAVGATWVADEYGLGCRRCRCRPDVDPGRLDVGVLWITVQFLSEFAVRPSDQHTIVERPSWRLPRRIRLRSVADHAQDHLTHVAAQVGLPSGAIRRKRHDRDDHARSDDHEDGRDHDGRPRCLGRLTHALILPGVGPPGIPRAVQECASMCMLAHAMRDHDLDNQGLGYLGLACSRPCVITFKAGSR